jgi:hypothetical protein
LFLTWVPIILSAYTSVSLKSNMFDLLRNSYGRMKTLIFSNFNLFPIYVGNWSRTWRRRRRRETIDLLGLDLLSRSPALGPKPIPGLCSAAMICNLFSSL